MKFVLLDQEAKLRYGDEIAGMLKAGDREFVPPLSVRSSTTQKDLSQASSELGGIEAYCGEMLRQEVLCAFERGVLLGFVSFRLNFANDVIPADASPNIYISTLIVKPEARGRDLTRKMYRQLFDVLYPSRWVFTRTWSTNFAHLRILEGFGFALLARKENDRGQGIDTVYFSKAPMGV